MKDSFPTPLSAQNASRTVVDIPEMSHDDDDDVSPHKSNRKARRTIAALARWTACAFACVIACCTWIVYRRGSATYHKETYDVYQAYCFVTLSYTCFGVQAALLSLLTMVVSRLLRLPHPLTIIQRLKEGRSAWAQALGVCLEHMYLDINNPDDTRALFHPSPHQPRLTSSYGETRKQVHAMRYGSFDDTSDDPLDLEVHALLDHDRPPTRGPRTAKAYCLSVVKHTVSFVIPFALLTWATLPLNETLVLTLHTHLSPPLLYTLLALCALYTPLLTCYVFNETLHRTKLVLSLLSFLGVFLYVFGFRYCEAPLRMPHQSVLHLAPAALEAMMCGFLFTLYMCFYKYYKIRGRMLNILAFQGCVAGLICLVTFPLLCLWYPPRLTHLILYGTTLSTTRFRPIAFTSLCMVFFYFSLNQALRWGSPNTLLSALFLAFVLGDYLHVLPYLYEHSSLFALIGLGATGVAFILYLFLYLMLAIKDTTSLLIRDTPLHSNHVPPSSRNAASDRQASLNEDAQAVIGADYIM